MSQLHIDTRRKLYRFNSQSDIKVSKHALIRFTQRKHRVSAKNIKSYLRLHFQKVINELVTMFKNFTHCYVGLYRRYDKAEYFFCENLNFVVRNNVIITVKKESYSIV